MLPQVLPAAAVSRVVDDDQSAFDYDNADLRELQ